MSTNQNQKSKCNQILSKLDIFSYIPVPHTYPISSSKSKISSIIFISVIFGYFIYDFVKLITANTPVINLSYYNTPDNKIYEMPNVAFAFLYGSNLNQTLNDPSYLTFQFDTMNSSYVNGTQQTNKTSVKLIRNCQPQWLGIYNNVYKNLSCVLGSPKIMNSPLKKLTSITQRLTIAICVPGLNLNTTCKNATEIESLIAGSSLIVIVNQPSGFDFKNAQISQTQYPFQIFQFSIIQGLYNRISLPFVPYTIKTFPTFLTTFTARNFFYFKSSEPEPLLSNVSIYNPYLIGSLIMSVYAQSIHIDVHYETIIQKLSMWGALGSLIFAVIGLCCLAYNKNKFLKKNPTWKQFDKVMKKTPVKLPNTVNEKQDENSIGIYAIRKQVELTHSI